MVEAGNTVDTVGIVGLVVGVGRLGCNSGVWVQWELVRMR